MPFDPDVKVSMLIRCARLCCLCWKPCGTNIEVAHIKAEADGGLSDPNNGIPVCFDCHQEIGAYDDKHPRGNKFRNDELRARRDHTYQLVETGALQAQIIAARARQDWITDFSILPVIPAPLPLSTEATRFLAAVMTSDGLPHALDRKFLLLSEQDCAQVLDRLLSEVNKHSQAISALGQIVRSPEFDRGQAVIVAEQTVRSVTLFGDIDAKVALLQNFPEMILADADESLRLALFEDLIHTVREDQFAAVNKLVPVLVNHANAIPDMHRKDYVFTLLDQAESSSHRGAPAAQNALTSLPDSIAASGIRALDAEYLLWHYLKKSVKRFVSQYAHLAGSENRGLLDDFNSLGYRDFTNKYSDEF